MPVPSTKIKRNANTTLEVLAYRQIGCCRITKVFLPEYPKIYRTANDFFFLNTGTRLRQYSGHVCITFHGVMIKRIRVGLPWSRCGRCRWNGVSAGKYDRPRSRGARKICTSRRLNSSSYRTAWTRCPSPVSNSTAVDCCRTARKTFGSAQYITIRK